MRPPPPPPPHIVGKSFEARRRVAIHGSRQGLSTSQCLFGFSTSAASSGTSGDIVFVRA